MKVILNGEARSFTETLSMQELLMQLQIDPETVAIEQNGTLIGCDERPNTHLSEGDCIEIVQFIGGG